MTEKPDDIIVFKHFENVIDANIAKTKLDAYGVPCFLTEENMASLYPGQGLNAFKIRLHLFAADQERAAQILNATLRIQGDVAGACPRCHSENVTRTFPKKYEDKLIYVLFGIFFPHRKVNHCMDCDLEF